MDHASHQACPVGDFSSAQFLVGWLVSQIGVLNDMSLTTFLAKPDVRAKFSSEFAKPKLQVKREIVAPPLTKRYSLVGTAFDYLMRFHIEYLNPQFIKKQGWIAEAALHLLSDEFLEKGEAIVAKAKTNLNCFLETGKYDDELLKSALLLAGLDPIFRAGVGQEYIGLIDEQDVQDLRKLISAIDLQIFKAEKYCLLNPTFGKASLLVGGADADLIIDGSIIEIKTTKSLELTRDYFNQLIGYYILYMLGGINGERCSPEISKLAIYFSRYAYFHVIEIDEIISHESFPHFVKWFEKRASQDLKAQHGRLSSEKVSVK